MDNAFKNTIAYAILNLGLDSENKTGIAVFSTGQLTYQLIKKKDIVLYQDYAYPMLWQIFWDSILMDEKKNIFLDSLFVFGSIYFSQFVFENRPV